MIRSRGIVETKLKSWATRQSLRFAKWNARIFDRLCGFWVLRSMKDLLIRSALWTVLCLMLCWGILSVFSQRTLRRFMEWYVRADKWSTQDPTLESKTSLSQRIAGIIAVLIGLTGAWFLLGDFRQQGHRVAPLQPPPDETTGNHGPVWVFGVALILYGVYMILKPEEYQRVVGSGFPNRRLKPQVASQGKLLGRVIGIIQFVGGVYILFHWYLQ